MIKTAPMTWFVALAASCATNTLGATPSNILFIYTDDHSHRTVGCYPESYPFVKTPNIDQLAADGVRFKYAYIGTWCMPSRASVLTGHYQHGVMSMRMEGRYPGSEYDPAQCPFWPRVFRAEGFQTAQIGKWHTGTDTGFGRDWDFQIVWNRPRYPENAGNYFHDQLIEFQGGEPKLTKGYSTDNYTKWATDYLKGEGRDPAKPWFLWLCYAGVHAPFTPADRHVDAYEGVRIPVPEDIYPPREGKPAYMQEVQQWAEGEDGQPHFVGKRRVTGELSPSQGIHGSSLNDWVRQYHQGVLAIDEAVGELIATLKETGQYDNTLIVFTSDQGIAFGQHGYRIKVAPYDANIRSPLIISMPSTLPRGKVCDTPVGGTDLAPTVFDFAGIELPWTMHGRSIMPLLHEPERNWDRPLLTTLTGYRYGSDTDVVPSDPRQQRQAGNVPWYVSLHDGRFKYIRTLIPGEVEELYDLDNDPEELTNLAGNEKYHQRVRTMRQHTIDELRRTGAGYANGLPPVAELVSR